MSEGDALRLLLVDDEESIRKLCVRALEKAGYQLRTAASGAEALALTGFVPDILIVDLGLPDTNGLQVANALHARNPSLVTLLISGDAIDDQQRAQLRMPHTILEKPFMLSQLQWALNALALRRRLLLHEQKSDA